MSMWSGMAAALARPWACPEPAVGRRQRERSNREGRARRATIRRVARTRGRSCSQGSQRSQGSQTSRPRTSSDLDARSDSAAIPNCSRLSQIVEAVAQRSCCPVYLETSGMPQNFIACDRDQVLLLPPSLGDWLPEDHLAWLVLEAVDELDLCA